MEGELVDPEYYVHLILESYMHLLDVNMKVTAQEKKTTVLYTHERIFDQVV